MEDIELRRAAREGDGVDLSSAFERLRLREAEGRGDRRDRESISEGAIRGS